MKKWNLNWRKAWLLAALALVAMLSSPSATATTRTVTSLNDGGAGSLRDTILASASGDTINFSVTGIITLTNELVIARNLTIRGPIDAKLTVSGDEASRVFNILSATVNISNLTISSGRAAGANGANGTSGSPNGRPGESAHAGGIFNQGTLTLMNCTLSANSAIAGNGGAGNISGSNSGDGGGGGQGTGGGIYNAGTLTLIDCTLHQNSAIGGLGGSGFPGGLGGSAIGGGIYNAEGALTLVNCTLSGNTATGARGGSAPFGADNGGNGGGGTGGGIFDDNGDHGSMLNLTSCTFSGNSGIGGAGGNGVRGGAGGPAGGGGLFSSSGSASIHNTIFAENTAAGGSGGNGTPNGNSGSGVAPDIEARVNSQGHNLIGRTDGNSGWVASDLLGGTTAGTRLNPLLGPLQDNGGLNFTRALLAGSAAIDAADDSISLTTDQRGHPRRAGAHVDIGAYEVNPPLSHEVKNTFDNGPGSLREAIVLVAPGDSIHFSSSVTGAITLTSGELAIDKNVTITGPGAKILALNGNNSHRFFHITGGTVSISGLTMTNAGAPDGGCIRTEAAAQLTMADCTVSGNNPPGTGIGIFNAGTLLLTNSTLSGNSGTLPGGAIYNTGFAVVRNSTISGNRANFGAGIYNEGTLTVANSTISSNVNVVGSKIGGGIYNNAGVVTVSSSIIARNTAAGGGPDVFGAFTSGGYNLIGKTNGASGFANGVNRDQAGSIAAPLNPVLGPLADNDGPTFTHALLSGSPAIDKGKSFGLTIDQRGRPRSFDLAGIANATGGDGSDIGAFEVNPPLLRIGRSANNNVLVSWPASDTGFILQAKTSLNPSVDWSNIPGTPAIVANRFVVTESAASGNKFYRLKSP